MFTLFVDVISKQNNKKRRMNEQQKRKKCTENVTNNIRVSTIYTHSRSEKVIFNRHGSPDLALFNDHIKKNHNFDCVWGSFLFCFVLFVAGTRIRSITLHIHT